MIRNISYNNPTIRAEIDETVGQSFGWMVRIKMGGIGSRRMLIAEASPRLFDLLSQQNTAHYGYIELRPTGLIVHFRSILETYGWVIPFHQLSIFQNGDQFSLHAAGEHMKFTGINGFKPDYSFFKKLMTARDQWRTSFPQHPEHT